MSCAYCDHGTVHTSRSFPCLACAEPFGFLLEACETLHGHTTGASDRLEDWNVEKLAAYLRKTLDEWQPSRAKSERYDSAVRELIAATLAELEISE